MEVQKFSYDNTIVRNFAYATVIWGIIGMLVGLTAALQLAFRSSLMNIWDSAFYLLVELDHYTPML